MQNTPSKLPQKYAIIKKLHTKESAMKEWVKAIVILPFNVIITIPCLLLYFAGYQYKTPPLLHTIIGLLLLLFGSALAVWTMVLFCKIGKGTPAPWAAPKHLVVEGPYKIVRNPMLTGVLSILSAEALLLNTVIIFYWVLLFFVINCFYFKFIEEKGLERKFGDDYIKYRKNVPMWIPKLKLK